MSDLVPATSALGRSFQLLELADMVICSPAEAAVYSGQRPVGVLDFEDAGWLGALSACYERVCGIMEEHR